MSDPTKSRIGYVIASFGMLVILVTLFLLYQGTITAADKGVLGALVLVGVIMVGFGMYAVVPQESHDFVTDAGGVARDLFPRFGRSKEEPGQQPTVVQAAPGQTTVVQPPAGPAVAVGPQGNVTVATDSAPSVPKDPELATGAALPLVSRTPMPPPAGKATPHAIKRQSLYPPDDA